MNREIIRYPVRIGYGRTLRLVCPGGWWIGLPSAPFKPRGLLIWGAPPGAVAHVRVGGTPIAGSAAGMSARQFDPSGAFERLNALIEWPTIEPSIGVEVELRTASAKLITDLTNPDVELALYGVQVVP